MANVDRETLKSNAYDIDIDADYNIKDNSMGDRRSDLMACKSRKVDGI